MSDDSYYTVLGISESATQDEIKRAYRDVIRQVHPDSVPNASPYWRRTAEERSKEINEAYHVLADPSQRLSYNAQLAKYLQRPVPATPPSPPKAEVTTTRSYNRPPSLRHQQRNRKRGYNWQPLKRWAAKYPLLACSLAGCGKTRFEADAVPRNSLVSTAQPDKKKVCVEKTSNSWMCSAM